MKKWWLVVACGFAGFEGSEVFSAQGPSPQFWSGTCHFYEVVTTLKN